MKAAFRRPATLANNRYYYKNSVIEYNKEKRKSVLYVHVQNADGLGGKIILFDILRRAKNIL